MSLRVLDTIKPAPRNAPSALYADFISSPLRGLPPFLDGVEAGVESWRRTLERVRNELRAEDPSRFPALMERLIEDNERMGASRAILEKLEAAASGGACFIVTGQQPGILGGALMVWHKIATAMALARHLEERLQVQCIPLYWCGADDADFEEVRNFSGMSAGLSPIRISVPPEAHESARPVGAIAKSWTGTMWESIAPVLDGFPSVGFVRGALEKALSAGADHGEVTASFLLNLSGGAFAVADGRADYIKAYGRSVFARYLEHEDAVKTLVRRRGAELEGAGYHAQLAPGDDSGIFLIEDGKRKKVTRDAAGRLEAAVREDIEQCSPGVILRNLIQDHAFRPLAVVLGPAELAYRAQVSVLYPFFEIGAPVPVPRMTGTFIPPPMIDALERSHLTCEEFIEAPARLADALAGSMLGPRMEEVRTRANDLVNESLREYLEEVSRVLPEKEAAKYKSHVEEGRRRLERSLGRITDAGKEAASHTWPWIGSVEAIIAPQGEPQERIISLIVPFLFGGEGASDELARLGARFVHDLLDGKPAHYVYSL